MRNKLKRSLEKYMKRIINTLLHSPFLHSSFVLHPSPFISHTLHLAPYITSPFFTLINVPITPNKGMQCYQIHKKEGNMIPLDQAACVIDLRILFPHLPILFVISSFDFK